MEPPLHFSNPISVRSSRFKYYIHDSVEICRLQLIGELSESEVGELKGCWATAKTTLDNRKLIVDVRAVHSIDEAGRDWLDSMVAEGASRWKRDVNRPRPDPSFRQRGDFD